jgi:hypothetical protein
MFFATEEGCWFKHNWTVFIGWPEQVCLNFQQVDSEMMANSVYSCDQLSDGSYVIGTVSNGVLFWPPKERLNIIFLKTKVE